MDIKLNALNCAFTYLVLGDLDNEIHCISFQLLNGNSCYSCIECFL